MVLIHQNYRYFILKREVILIENFDHMLIIKQI